MTLIQILFTAGLLLTLFLLWRISNPPKAIRYKIWHRPWIALAFIILSIYIYTKLLDWLTRLIPWDEFYIELLYALVAGLVWAGFRWLLNKSSVHEFLIKIYRSIVKDPLGLPYPYFYYNENIRARVGRVFLTIFFNVIIGVIASLLLTKLLFFSEEPFFINTGFLFLPVVFIIDYLIYLQSEALTDVPEIITEPERKKSDFLALWRLYLATYRGGISTAWYKHQHIDKEQLFRENDMVIRQITKVFSTEKKDVIVADLDITQSFYKLVPLFMHAINRGGNVLIAVDIPSHFSPNFAENLSQSTDISDTYMTCLVRELSYLLAAQLPGVRDILDIHLFQPGSSSEIFKNRVLLTSVNTLTNNELDDKEWLSEVKLFTVINFYDRGISNLFENRKFNILLNEICPDHQTLIITPNRADLQSALMQTWLFRELIERRLQNPVNSATHYFIGFDFERWNENWNAIASGNPPHDIYAGLEIIAPAIEKKIDAINYLDIAYNQVIEGYEEMANYADYIDRFTITKSEILSRVRLKTMPIVEIPGEHVFSVIYDTENNAPKIYRKWLHLGTEENFSVLISLPHLFRDYFNHNFAYFQQHPAEAIQPRLSKSHINLALILLRLLQSQKIFEDNLLNNINRYGLSTTIGVPAILATLFEKYFSFNIQDNFSLTAEYVTVFENGDFAKKIRYSLTEDALIDSNPGFEFLRQVKVVDSSQNVLFEILRDLVYQNYLPGQIHAFNGRAYEIMRLTSNGDLVVKGVKPNNTLFYKQLVNIVINQPLETKINSNFPVKWRSQGNEYQLAFDAFECSFDINVEGYLDFRRQYHDPEFAKETNIKRFTKQELPHFVRRYRNGRIMKISWQLMPEFQMQRKSLALSFQLVFGEALKFFFPYHHQYLVVATQKTANQNLHDVAGWLFPDIRFNVPSDNDTNDHLVLYVLEDANIDLGLINAIEANFQYILIHIFDYLLWLNEDDTSGEHWYAEYYERADLDKLAFLRYGGKSLPPWLDIDLLKEFIQKNYPIDSDKLYELQKNRKRTPFSMTGACDFCKTELKKSELRVLNDGRMRCASCSSGAIDTLPQFMELYKHALELYKNHLGIDFAQYPHEYHFVSATELHKKGDYPFSITDMYDIREAIGIAFDRTKDFVIIEDGYKAEPTLSTIIHELAHIWQFQTPAYSKAKTDRIEYCEGMTVWAEYYLMKQDGKTDFAESYLSMRLRQSDKYGDGIRFVMETCPDNPFEWVVEKYPTNNQN
jgi:hypothetical protein